MRGRATARGGEPTPVECWRFSVSDQPLDFEVEPGEEQVLEAEVRNECASITLELTAGFSSPGPSALSPNHLSLGPGESATLRARFTPEEPGTWTRFLVVVTDESRVEIPITAVSPDPVGPQVAPSRYLVEGWFGLDPDTGQAVPWRWTGEDQPILLRVSLIDERWFEDEDPDFLCLAELSTWEPLALAPWAAEERLSWALDLPTEAEWSVDCRLDEEGEALLATLGGLGLEPLHDAAANILADYMTSAQWEAEEPYVLGAGYTRDGEYEGLHYGTAWQADEDLDIDGLVRMPAAEALGGEPLAPAVYQVWTKVGMEI